MSMVPLLLRDWWDDMDRPSRLWDQNFGLGLRTDDLLAPITPLLKSRGYIRPWGLLGRQNSGHSTITADKDKFQVPFLSRGRKDKFQITSLPKDHKDKLQITSLPRDHKDKLQITFLPRDHKDKFQITSLPRDYKKKFQVPSLPMARKDMF